MKTKRFLVALLLFTVVIAVGCKNSDTATAPVDNDLVTLMITPQDGATNVSTQAVIEVRFSRPMMGGSMDTMSSSMLHRGWGTGTPDMMGTMSWNSDHTMMTFRPSMMLDSNMTYTFHMMGMMMDREGGMRHIRMDTTGSMAGMNSGMMMGGMREDEIRVAFCTGPQIQRQIPLTLTSDIVYIADGGSGDITAINPATNQVIGVQPIDNVRFVHHFSLSPDRMTLVISDAGEDLSEQSGGNTGGGHGGGHSASSRSAIILLDSRTLLETGRISADGIIHNGVISPDGNFLYIAKEAHGMVHKYSLPGLSEVAAYTVGTSPLEVTLSPDGGYAFVANSGSNTISRINLTNGEVNQLSVGNVPVGAWISPDGLQGYVTNEGSKSIDILNLTTFRIDTTLSLGYTPGQAAGSPTRQEVYIADEDNGKIHIFDRITDRFIGEIVTGTGAHGIAFSADGNRAYITNEIANTVSVLDCTNRTVIATIPVGMRPNGVIYRTAL